MDTLHRSDELKDIVTWLKTELHGLENRACGMDVIESDLIKQIEEEVEECLKAEDTTAKRVFLQVKPQLLYKSGLHLRSVPPDPNSQNRLFDRIRCVRSGFSVPLGAKGTIIGVRNGNNPTDTMYDVLFDKPFMGEKHSFPELQILGVRKFLRNILCLRAHYRRTYVKRMLSISRLSFGAYGFHKYQLRRKNGARESGE